MPTPELDLQWSDPPNWDQSSGVPVALGAGSSRRVFMIPARWKLSHPEGVPGLAYVMTAGGIIYALTVRGSVRVPGRLQAAARRRHFSDGTEHADRARELDRVTRRLARSGAR